MKIASRRQTDRRRRELPIAAACQGLGKFSLIFLNVESLEDDDLRMLLRLLSSITYRMVEKTKAIIMQEDISDVANGTYLVEVFSSGAETHFLVSTQIRVESSKEVLVMRQS